MKIIPVILSGGAGTRLWPVSRKAYPKPFMQLADGNTLAGLTFDRALDIASDGAVMTVTSRDYYFLCKDIYKKHKGCDLDKQTFLLEPMGRNTAPAIALAALQVKKQYGGDAIMVVMPSDHLIKDKAAFKQAVHQAAELASQGYLTTFGIFPTQPETGYGYIKAGEGIANSSAAVVEKFVEKPSLTVAKSYLASGEYSWNSGMFCFTADALIAAMDNTAQEVMEKSQDCFNKTDTTGQQIEFDAQLFGGLPDISIDYAVMEHADKRAVVDSRFDWNDIGSWNAMSTLSESDEHGNRVEGKAITIDSNNCYIRSGDRLVATVGVDDLMVVDTQDAVLIAHKDKSQGVKDVVQFLKSKGHEAAVFHKTVHRPWGSFTILEDEDDCKVKRLVVKPGQVLSLQLHHRRSEHWTVVSGTAKVRVGDDEFLLEENKSVYIPVETLHRLENPTDTDIALIEVQCGDYFGEDDIERFEDIYGRMDDKQNAR
ncbi:mannose-1-phosphate guanylyltransferase/mannose-6-phosphate isomerase [Marinicella rhabdoformis]|uniref:mannose-1-phosphate guanylyltransferase/mannose-6-phosphate isomerase n=1 Tax=Marinicella rhabdoformis TaxID=2580566 RepID=UPI0012AECB7F|nr:mannose-1-phosphate guanylyltransferase/mannose-6-phosphate isomerase [Marinicella rhabdoformis]